MESNTKKEKSIVVISFEFGNTMTGVSNESQNSGHMDGSPQPLDLTSSAPVFHPRCGQLVTLSQASRTASRTHATQVTETAILELFLNHLFFEGIQPRVGPLCRPPA